MRRWFATLRAGISRCSGLLASSSTSSRSGLALLKELESLPVGLEVIHAPAQVRTRVGPNLVGWLYRWLFRTEVRAIERPISIVLFGICAWDGKQWILPANNRRYNAGVLDQMSFEEWYSCPDARIAPGKPAVDPSNWAGSRAKAAFRQKWFYVGKDDHGKRYKGEAVVELLATD
jgi:hypothetical protein